MKAQAKFLDFAPKRQSLGMSVACLLKLGFFSNFVESFFSTLTSPVPNLKTNGLCMHAVEAI